jgi:Tol biopolymer transport system component
MKEITHRQARRYMQADLDGLLGDARRLDLKAHLAGCETCRAESESLSMLTSRLQSEFHERWDAHNGPSQNVTANVRSQTRRIIMSNKFKWGLGVLGGIAVLLLLGFGLNILISQLRDHAVAANNTPDNNMPVNSLETNSQLIAFASTAEDGNAEIYTMHTDGSNQVNITRDPANDTSPVWSSDGKRLAFLSDRSGSLQIYSMNPDGTELIQLTNISDTEYWGYKNWSPDGKYLVAQRIPIESTSSGRHINLYLINTDGSGAIQLTENESRADHSPKWSPGGEQIAFIRSESKSNRILSQIYTIRTDGTGLFNLSNPGRDDAAFTWSADGAWITHFSSPNNCPFPGDCPASEIQSVRADGTERATLLVLPNSLTLDVARTDWSPDGMRVVMVSWDSPLGSAGNSYLSILSPFSNSDIVSRKIPGHIAQAYWSPDGQFFIYDSDVSGNWDIYTLDANEVLQNPEAEPIQRTNSPREDTSPAWQPVITEETLAEQPPQPYEGLVAFTSAVENGNLDIYTMRPDGSGLTNLTNDPAHDVDPYWSPNGKRIAFLSDRAGYMQVFVMNADGSDVFQLTHREADHSFQGLISDTFDPWSPDGSTLAFLERTPDGGQLIYTMEANGRNGLPLVYPPENYSSISWSPDGSHIAYIEFSDDIVPQIHVIDAEGEGIVTLTDTLPAGEVLFSNTYSWTRNGRAISFVAYKHINEGQDQWIAYEAEVNGGRLVAKATSSTPMHSWWDGTTFVQGSDLSPLTWLRSDGTFSELEPLENCPPASNAQYGFLAQRSSKGSLLVSIQCPNKDLWFYRSDHDGTETRQILNAPLTANGGLNGIFWSPADRYAALNVSASGVTHLYVLDVENGSILTTIPIGGGDLYYNISWQPVMNEGVAAEDIDITGDWVANTDFGKLILTVNNKNPNTPKITKIRFLFSEWACGSIIYSSEIVDASDWPVVDNKFSAVSSSSPYFSNIFINGTYDTVAHKFFGSWELISDDTVKFR